MEDLKIIKKIVEIRTGLTGIEKKDRTRDYTFARFLYFKLASVMTPATFQKIGRAVCRDHSTVIYGLKQFDNMGHRFPYYQEYLDIKSYFKGIDIEKTKFQTIEECQNHYLNEISRITKSYSLEIQKLRAENERSIFLNDKLKELSDVDYSDLLNVINNFIKVRTKLNSNTKTFAN